MGRYRGVRVGREKDGVGKGDAGRWLQVLVEREGGRVR